MSRQFDDAFNSGFELYGEWHPLVNPTSLSELKDAFTTRSMIQEGINGCLHDEDSSHLEECLAEQEDLIRMYADELGDFDNSILISNTNYLAREVGMRISDLEKILSLSAGYISRTAKEGSGKKLSIDVAWKIAQFFSVDIRTLIETDLSAPETNTSTVLAFIRKLDRQTQDKDVVWKSLGGYSSPPDNRLVETGLVPDLEFENTNYSAPQVGVSNLKWKLQGNIFAVEKFDKNASLVVVPYRLDLPGDAIKTVTYDFLLMYSAISPHYEMLFSTYDDPSRTTAAASACLYQHILDAENDIKISVEARSILTKYLNK